MVNMSLILNNPNQIEIQKVIDKRAKLIADITLNNVFVNDYQRKLARYTKQIERLYSQGLRRCKLWGNGRHGK